MTCSRVLWTPILTIFAILCAVSVSAQELPMTGPLTGEVLYLQAGTIQTVKFPDLLGSEEQKRGSWFWIDLSAESSEQIWRVWVCNCSTTCR